MTPARQRILIAEDDPGFRDTLVVEFTERQYAATGIASIAEFTALPRKTFELAVIDLKLDADSGLELLERLLHESPDAKAVVLTGYGSIATAVQAVKLGAVNYLTKPVSMGQLETALVEPQDETAPKPYHAPSLARHEWEYIEYVLHRCEGNISQAARTLGLHRQSLQRKLRKYPPRS